MFKNYPKRLWIRSMTLRSGYSEGCEDSEQPYNLATMRCFTLLVVATKQYVKIREMREVQLSLGK